MNTELSFRKAVPGDEALVLRFVRMIAAYEKMSHEVVATEESFAKWLFEQPKAEVVFAMVNGREIGFALYFYNFSTFTGTPGLYLEDIFVEPEFRGHGYGKALFEYLRAKAAQEGCARMDWVCLDWNEPSIAFYKSMGADAMDQWTIYRLTRDKICAQQK